jgi:hypothetical protein
LPQQYFLYLPDFSPAGKNREDKIVNVPLSKGPTMFSKLFLSEKDLEAIQQAFYNNPLLASLFIISPAEAFKYLNLMPRFLDALLPLSDEDARLAQSLVQALRQGRTTLEHPQAVEPASEPVEPPATAEPRPLADADLGRPDITLSISKAALQHTLRLYVENNFKNQEFAFPVQRWLDINAKGESIALELTLGRARLIAKLRGTLMFRPTLMRFDLHPRKVAFPIEIDLLVGISVDQDNQLFLSVSEGEMSIVNPPLPGRVASDLVEKITSAVPSIPLVQVPTRFEIPGDPSAELVMRLSNVSIGDDDLKLELHLDA